MTYIDVCDKGQGGFAKVIVVKHVETGRLYAKKIYSPQQSIINAVGDEHLKKRFKREVRYQSSLNHPNIAPILEHFLDDEPPYFIMPLAEETLQDELSADSTLGGDPRSALFDILAGLEILHSEGFVHRDLKPANVLKFQGETKTYYALSDFGLITGIDSESSTLTGSNDSGGTPNYAAPELIHNFKAATPLADIYSFGAILHDIFGNGTKRLPYTELSVPGALGRIVTKCTKKLARRRYPSVIELREDLYDVLNTAVIVFNSSSEEDVVNLLRNNSSLNDEQWDSVFLQLESNVNKSISCANIFSAITEPHINELYENAPELLAALGEYFSDYITNGTFNFDYCDVLASRAQVFYNLGGIQLKAKIAIGLLVLGTSHNRWYVERKFVSMADTTIPDNLANRIKVELEVQGIDFKGHIDHLTRSIGVSRAVLHPILQPLSGVS
ncbi:serine/threonine-protein kinase [Aeromonas caviae]